MEESPTGALVHDPSQNLLRLTSEETANLS